MMILKPLDEPRPEIGGGVKMEILASGTVKDLVVGSGIEFAERGDYELKGVPGTWRIFTVEGG